MALRVHEKFAHGNFRLREGILGNFASVGIEAIQSVLLVRGVPDHLVAVDANGIGAGGSAGQIVFLDFSGVGIEPADLVADALGEPDIAGRVEFEALRLAFGGRRELGDLTVLVDAHDGPVVAEDGEPLVALAVRLISIGAGRVEVREFFRFRIEFRDGAAARPDVAVGVDAHSVLADSLAVG